MYLVFWVYLTSCWFSHLQIVICSIYTRKHQTQINNLPNFKMMELNPALIFSYISELKYIYVYKILKLVWMKSILETKQYVCFQSSFKLSEYFSIIVITLFCRGLSKRHKKQNKTKKKKKKNSLISSYKITNWTKKHHHQI